MALVPVVYIKTERTGGGLLVSGRYEGVVVTAFSVRFRVDQWC